MEQTVEFYENILESVNYGVWVTDVDDVIFYENRAMGVIADKPEEQIVGTRVLEDFPEDMLEIFKPLYLKAKKTMKPVSYDAIQVVIPGGRQSYQSGWLIPREKEGKYDGMICTVEDVNDKKLTMQKLLESEERYRTVANFTYDWEYWLGPDGDYLYVSPSCERITGYSAYEFLKDSSLLKKIIHPADVESVGTHISDSIGGKDVSPIDFRVITRGGDVRWIGHVCQSVFGEDGRFMGIRASNRDITDVRNAERLRMENVALEDTNRLKTEFLASMSHEFRTPLNAIIGYSEILLDQFYGELNEKQIENINYIYTGGNLLLKFIDDILDFYRIEVNRLELEVKRLEIDEIIDEVIESGMPGAREKRHELEVNVEDGLTVWADRRRVVQCLNNLLDNAIKFTPEGGRISINARSRNGDVEISVRDSGIGIPADKIESIFLPFYRINGSTKAVAGGSGLGLSITRKLVESMGGTVRVESTPGTGSTFYISLPAHPPGETGEDIKE